MHTHEPTDRESHPHRPTRRSVLAGAVGATVAALAGCLNDDEADEPTPDPVDLAGQECDVCGMLIDEHHGPAGQAFYDEASDDRDGLARFDSVTELVVYLDERAAAGEEPRAVYVTDYSRVDYEVTEIDGGTYVSSHVDADDFADATTLGYVTGSEVKGAMGADHMPFSDADDAAAFAASHGGEVVGWDDLDGES